MRRVLLGYEEIFDIALCHHKKIDFSKNKSKRGWGINDFCDFFESIFFVDRSGWLMAQNNRKMIGLKCKEVDFSIFSKNH